MALTIEPGHYVLHGKYRHHGEHVVHVDGAPRPDVDCRFCKGLSHDGSPCYGLMAHGDEADAFGGTVCKYFTLDGKLPEAR